MSQEKEVANQPNEAKEVKEVKEVKEENKEKDESSKQEKPTENLPKFSNEVRVDLKSPISSLLVSCEQILNSQKTKELLLSGSGKSITKLVTLAEIVKSIYPSLIQDTLFSIISVQAVEEGPNVEVDEKGKFSPKLEIRLSEKEPQGKVNEKISEEKKEKLLQIWEKEKEGKTNNTNNKNTQKRKVNINNMNNGNRGRVLNRGRNISPNNRRIGFVKRWGFGYGNNGVNWNNGNNLQGKAFWNGGNWNMRYFNFNNINRNYVNNWNRRFQRYY
jgi:DNA-binding protein